jgi:PAS domain S-box-containing protein
MSALHDSEICRSILENLPTGLCVVDMQKKIVYWSDGAERITGRPRHEVIGHSCIGEALLQCDQPGCEFCNEDCPLARAIKTSQPAEAAGFLHHKAGHEIPVRIRAVPVRNAHGSIIGAVETFEEQQPTASPDHHEDGLNLPGCVDQVTGVASHAMMQSHLRETLGTFTEVGVPFGVLCFRLEGLEQFRTNFGPEAVSSLLRVVARTLEGALWKTDFVGRWGNGCGADETKMDATKMGEIKMEDQFLVILNGCREEALHAVRERLRRMLANAAIEWWGERRSLPVSVGLATAQSGDTIESVITRVQQSLPTAAGLARAATSNPSSGS